MLIGSVEAGGTKFVCAVGNEDYRVKDQIQFPTTTPEETLKRIVDYFKQYPIEAIGVASFGPIEIKQNSSKYGYITTTPKSHWKDTDFVGYLKKYLSVPISWTTDVNGSAYGEYEMSLLANEQINSLVYYTIGTGVGGGAVINGDFVGSEGHPEMGHVLLKHHPDDSDFKGVCPYHGDCLEGLVSGPTFEARVGKKGQDVPLSEPVWDIMAYYIAQAALQATLLFRPNKIIFGGGVISERVLYKVRNEFSKMINGYLPLPDLDKYIVMPEVKDNGSATLGNLALAVKLLQS